MIIKGENKYIVSGILDSTVQPFIIRVFADGFYTSGSVIEFYTRNLSTRYRDVIACFPADKCRVVLDGCYE